jgi:glucans biosynthesis protein C
MMRPMSKERLPALDLLRFAVVVLVVLHHVAVTFMSFAPEWWYVLNQERSPVLMFEVILGDTFLMPAMFFASGLVTRPSLERRMGGEFLRQRFWRIGLPWILGTVLLAPTLTCVGLRSRGVLASFVDAMFVFWTRFYNQGPYWFLGVLFVFLCVSCLSHRVRRPVSRPTPSSKGPSLAALAVMVLVPAAGFVAGRPLGGVRDWVNAGYVWVFQPVRIIGYATYFTMGYVAAGRGWLSPLGARPELWRWAAATPILSFAWLATMARIPFPQGVAQTAVYGLVHSAVALSWCMLMLALAATLSERGFVPARTLTSTSYGIYFVHLPICALLAMPIVNTRWPLGLKWLALAVATLAASLVATLVLRKAPLARAIFR